MMQDYSTQNWRQPDPDTARDNEFAGICFALFVGVCLGATICGFWWS